MLPAENSAKCSDMMISDMVLTGTCSALEGGQYRSYRSVEVEGAVPIWNENDPVAAYDCILIQSHLCTSNLLFVFVAVYVVRCI